MYGWQVLRQPHRNSSLRRFISSQEGWMKLWGKGDEFALLGEKTNQTNNVHRGLPLRPPPPPSLSALSNKAILSGFGHAMQFGQRGGAAEASRCRKRGDRDWKGAANVRKTVHLHLWFGSLRSCHVSSVWMISAAHVIWCSLICTAMSQSQLLELSRYLQKKLVLTSPSTVPGACIVSVEKSGKLAGNVA